MSDGKEVRRWSLRQLDHLSSNSWTNEDFVSSTDHDRIVAELKAQLKEAADALRVYGAEEFKESHIGQPLSVEMAEEIHNFGKRARAYLKKWEGAKDE